MLFATQYLFSLSGLIAEPGFYSGKEYIQLNPHFLVSLTVKCGHVTK